jgi:hypothetical protein
MTREQAARGALTLALLIACWLVWTPLGWVTAQHEYVQVLDPLLRPLLLILLLGAVHALLARMLS